MCEQISGLCLVYSSNRVCCHCGAHHNVDLNLSGTESECVIAFLILIVQATSRDILCNSMKTLRCCSIVMHIHDELVIEADPKVSLEVLCEQMGRVPEWTPGLNLRADGYICDFYMKD